MGRRVLRRVLRRGSKKGLSRRHLEGRSTPFRAYDPLGVCPIDTQETLLKPGKPCLPLKSFLCLEPFLSCQRRVSHWSRVVYGPRSNKRCFLNGVFQSGLFKRWSASARAEGTKMLEKTGVFQAFFVPLKGLTSVGSRGEESEKHRLEPLGRFLFPALYFQGHPLNPLGNHAYQVAQALHTVCPNSYNWDSSKIIFFCLYQGKSKYLPPP